MEKLFKLSERGTSVRTELRAGITTFFAMGYIIFVNPAVLSTCGMSSSGVMIATCLSAAVGTIICALYSNQPFAMASGMGLNTFFAFTLCSADLQGYKWQQALAIVFIVGVLFLIITVTPLKDKIVDSIPHNLQYAISTGIGLFIAFIGLLNSGLINLSSGFPALGNLKEPHVLLALFGLIITIVFVLIKLRAPLLMGMIVMIIISLITGLETMPEKIVSLPHDLGDVFLKLDFNGLITGDGLGGILALVALLFSSTMVDMFDTIGFLIGAGAQMDSETALPEGSGRVLISDALGTIIGALMGTSNVTTYSESAAGIAAGGRTGLSAIVTAIGFLLAVFFSPLAALFTQTVAAPSLVIVGMYMVMSINKIDFSHKEELIPVFLTVIMMPFAYSITTGIGFGFISWTICKIFAGKIKELNPMTVIMSVVFVIYFCM
ncbi:MAG: NCS2 family permease [Lachnospiraceae bacterium]|nr:NCS2 family permease [Lachnospiraceae bacterium]